MPQSDARQKRPGYQPYQAAYDEGRDQRVEELMPRHAQSPASAVICAWRTVSYTQQPESRPAVRIAHTSSVLDTKWSRTTHACRRTHRMGSGATIELTPAMDAAALQAGLSAC